MLCSSKVVVELINRQTSLPNDGPQGSFGDFLMIRNSQSPVGRRVLSENDVAAALTIEDVADFFECFDDLAT